MEEYRIENIKQRIEIKREDLNKIIIEGLDKEKILNFSQELDILISEYYSVCKKI